MSNPPPPSYGAADKGAGYPPQQGYPQPGYNQPPPQQGYPQPGYNQPPPQQGYSAQTTTVVTSGQPRVVVAGTCAVCGVGAVSDNFTVLGIVLAILFFPIGVLCCFLLMEKRCDRCGAAF